MKKSTLVILICQSLLCSSEKLIAMPPVATGKAYYVSATGDDRAKGNKVEPWKTLTRVNATRLGAGDTVYLKGNETYSGTLVLSGDDQGKAEHPIVITSYGTGNALINAGNSSAITIDNSAYISVSRLSLTGSGRKQGNTKDGFAISHCHDIIVENIDVQGFQKAGLLVYVSSAVKVTKVYAHNNGFAGISVLGQTSKNDCRNVYIGYCKAENNPGDPTNFGNHSGNGIIAGMCRKVTIEYSSATNNGWDMPRKGNGPVGIWCYEADSVLIQYCIAYRNKTAPGAADGGGYDFDGGTTNSMIQYCLSYENEGSAFGLFQYSGATNWHDNTIRFCISENDGLASAAHAGVFIWNSSYDTAQLTRCNFYNNTIYNDKGAAISYAPENQQSGFRFFNNIFVAKDELITGREMNGIFLGNNWWSLDNKFKGDGILNFESWALQKGKEQFGGKIAGLNINPGFSDAGKTRITDPRQLKTFFKYRLAANSLLRSSGLDLKLMFGIDAGKRDFNQLALPGNGIGACF